MPGTSVANPTSTAMAASGFTPNAPVIAPRRPSSSCTVPTHATPTLILRLESWRKASAMTNAPILSSRLFEWTQVLLSISKLREKETGSPTWTSFSAAFWSAAPMSIHRSSIFGTALRSSGVCRWIGLRPITPGMWPFSVRISTPVPGSVSGSMPPTGRNETRPCGMMLTTWKPISS